MHRFFVPASRISGEEIEFAEDQRRQMLNVLRLRQGDLVAAFDGSGREFVAEINVLNGAHALGRIVEVRTPATEPDLDVTLVQSMPKGDKIEIILQKCTEIGVSSFLIMETERSVRRIRPEDMEKNLIRWRAIVREAAEQSGRTRVPSVDGVISFQDALARVKNSGISFIAWENEKEMTLSSALPSLSGAKQVSYLIGPEGGFSAEEIAAARTEGIIPVSLGPRTLRTETAAIVVSALIVYGPRS